MAAIGVIAAQRSGAAMVCATQARRGDERAACLDKDDADVQMVEAFRAVHLFPSTISAA